MKRPALLVFALLACVASLYGQNYKFTSLDYPGGDLTTGRGINDSGDIVGAYRVVPPRHALLIKSGQYIPIAPDSILGLDYSEATNINNRGHLTGQMADDNGLFHGFLVRDGQVTILDYPGASETFALGISDTDIVAGYWDILDQDFNPVEIHGFTWQNGVFTRFDLPGAAVTAIFGINARGDLAGVWQSDINSDVEHGFACPKTTPCYSFDAPVPGTFLTQADEINAQGQVVGVYVGTDFVWHAFLKDGTKFTTLDFPGSTGTGAYGINSAGQIVGKYFAADGSTHGFLAEPTVTGKPQ